MTALQWARLSAELDVRLRRGAWYRVLELRALEAVLDVSGARVTVPRPFVEIVRTPPNRWTVVQPSDAGARYAVCPNCRERQPLDGRRSEMRCRRCNGLFEVGWNEAYLGASGTGQRSTATR